MTPTGKLLLRGGKTEIHRQNLAARQGFLLVDAVSRGRGENTTMLKWLLIAGGGAVGSMLRYAMQGWVQRLTPTIFPVGTLAVNVLGCLLIGILAGMFAGPQLVREEYRIGLMVGVLGGFTTFSAFGLESFRLMQDGEARLMFLNVLLSCGIGFAAVWLGYRLAEHWFGV